MSQFIRPISQVRAKEMLLFFFFWIILPVICHGESIPAAVNTTVAIELTPAPESALSANSGLRRDTLYAVIHYDLAPGTAYTFEMSYPPVANSYGFAFFTSHPFSVAPASGPGFLFSKNMQNRKAPGKPNQITRTRFRVKPESTARRVYILFSVDAEPVDVQSRTATAILYHPEKPGVNLPAEMPGWPEMGKLYFYDDSGEILLK